MKLVGPWFSGPTRRVGVTLKLLGMPFEHLALHAYLQRDAVQLYSPMGKVPALLLDDGRTLFNSWNMIDYLHELVGPERALLPPAGVLRQETLNHVGTADAIYGKLTSLYDESLRPAEARVPSLTERWTEQVRVGFNMLEAAAGTGWLVGGTLSQADIFTVIVYETASRGLLPNEVHGAAYPRLQALTERAFQLAAFSETSPFA
jgi:glutathione S-transferase